jgi:PhzF family phenazine biosynthesis protein
MTRAPLLQRLAAFTTDPRGGNRAGVWIGDRLPDDAAMQAIAADLGYSETAFIAPREGVERVIRYFSPQAEVSFCGHATIAAGVALGGDSGAGRYLLETRAGTVPVDVGKRDDRWLATLESVPPAHRPPPDDLLADALACLGWRADELDPAIPPALAYAGAWHLVLAAATQARLAALDYPFERLRALMLGHGLTTLQLVWRAGPDRFIARNPFPVGGVVEDPATGAAAAALAGYLRDAGLLVAPAQLRIEQGAYMGRPGEIAVAVPEHGGILVSGGAVAIAEDDAD